MNQEIETNEAQPYCNLTPDTILDAVESVGLETDGRQLALNSYENRVYQVGIEDGDPLIAKFYRPGRWSDAAILEEHAFALELAEHEIPLVAPMLIDGTTLFEHAGYRFSLSPRCGGRAAELDREETQLWLGRFIGRMHAIGAASEFKHRPEITPQRFGWEPRAFLLEKQWVPMHLETAFSTLTEDLLNQIDSIFELTQTCRRIRLHGDFHVGNILWRDGPHFVDLDDCMTGPAIQDLWLLLSGEREEMSGQAAIILEGYRQFYDFDRRELQLIEPLRTLRYLHHAAWLARRWDDPAFPLAFVWFDSNRYWEDLILSLREQAAMLQEPPIELQG